jgi:hypothetical protein
MRAEFERRFAERHDTVHAEATSFSGSQVPASLQAVEDLAQRIATMSPERELSVR